MYNFPQIATPSAPPIRQEPPPGPAVAEKQETKPEKEAKTVSDMEQRVDALFMAVTRLTNKLETMDTALTSMRSTAKPAQAADTVRQKVDDLEQRLRSNEQAFAEFSSVAQREQVSKNASLDRLLLKCETLATQAYHRSITQQGKVVKPTQAVSASLTEAGTLVDVVPLAEIPKGTNLKLHYPMAKTAASDSAVYMLNVVVSENGDANERWVPIKNADTILVEFSI